MKRWVTFVAILFLISCTGSYNPPAPPVPPPVTSVCPDGVCDPGENCAPDCNVDPEPPPPVVIAPKVKTRWLTISPYGMFASPTADFEKIAADIYNSEFTGASVHLLSPWTKLPGEILPDDWPWQFKSGKFDLTKPNALWYQKLRRLLAAFGKYHLDLEISFVDQYCCTSTGLKAPSKVHPFRNNNLGFNWTGNPNQLYQSLTFPVRFHHITWEDLDEHALKWKFSVTSPAARAIDAYIQGVVAEVVAAMKTHPNLRVGWKWANETYGGLSVGDSRGDRSEMIVYVSEQFEKKGLKVSNRFFRFVDRDIRVDDPVEQKRRALNNHRAITRKYGQQDGLGSIHEIHSVCNKATLDSLIALGFNINALLPSTDGNECTNFYPTGPRDLVNMKVNGKPLPFLDIKMEEGWLLQFPYDKKQFMRNWSRYFPEHKGKILQ